MIGCLGKAFFREAMADEMVAWSVSGRGKGWRMRMVALGKVWREIKRRESMSVKKDGIGVGLRKWLPPVNRTTSLMLERVEKGVMFASARSLSSVRAGVLPLRDQI